MSDNLYSWFKLGRIGTGRRLTLFRQWQPLMAEFGMIAEQAYLEKAIEHDRQTQALEVRWKTRESTGANGPDTVALDQVLDSVVVGVHDMTEAQARGLSEDDPTQQAAMRVLSAAFPLGVGAVVKAPYVDQAAEVERMLAQFHGPLAADVATLHLGGMVERLAILAAEYRQAINVGNQRLTFDLVQAAQQRGLAYVGDLLVRILAHFADSDNPAHVESRARFLAPLANHDAMERAIRVARRRPDTGELSDGELSDGELSDDELPGELDGELEPGELEPGEAAAEEPAGDERPVELSA